METIDSSSMNVFREFDAAEEVVDNSERFRVGVLGDTVIIASFSRGGGWSGDVFFERANLADVVRALTEALGANPLHGPAKRGVLKGKDLMGVSVYEAGAGHGPGKIRAEINNNRPALMDGMQLNGWNVMMTVGTAQRLLVALEQLPTQ